MNRKESLKRLKASASRSISLSHSNISSNNTFNNEDEEESSSSLIVKQRQVFALNNQIAELGKILRIGRAEKELLERKNRIKAIKNLEKDKNLEERKKKLVSTDDAQNEYDSALAKNQELKESITQMNAQITHFVKEIQEVNKNDKPNDPNPFLLHEAYSDTVNLLQGALAIRKKQLEHGFNQEMVQNNLQSLTSQEENYKDQINKLTQQNIDFDYRIEQATKLLSLPCDALIEEENCISTLEKDVENMKQLLTESAFENEISQDIKRARADLNVALRQLEEHQKNYDQREEVFNKPKNLPKKIDRQMTKGAQTSISMMSDITYNRPFQMQTAQQLVFQVFDRLTSHWEENEKLISQCDKQEERNHEDHQPIIQDYQKKMGKIQSLKSQLDNLFKMRISISLEHLECDELKEQLKDNDIKINKLKRKAVRTHEDLEKCSKEKEELDLKFSDYTLKLKAAKEKSQNPHLKEMKKEIQELQTKVESEEKRIQEIEYSANQQKKSTMATISQLFYIAIQ